MDMQKKSFDDVKEHITDMGNTRELTKIEFAIVVMDAAIQIAEREIEAEVSKKLLDNGIEKDTLSLNYQGNVGLSIDIDLFYAGYIMGGMDPAVIREDAEILIRELNRSIVRFDWMQEALPGIAGYRQ